MPSRDGARQSKCSRPARAWPEGRLRLPSKSCTAAQTRWRPPPAGSKVSTCEYKVHYDVMPVGKAGDLTRRRRDAEEDAELGQRQRKKWVTRAALARQAECLPHLRRMPESVPQ